MCWTPAPVRRTTCPPSRVRGRHQRDARWPARARSTERLPKTPGMSRGSPRESAGSNRAHGLPLPREGRALRQHHWVLETPFPNVMGRTSGFSNPSAGGSKEEHPCLRHHSANSRRQGPRPPPAPRAAAGAPAATARQAARARQAGAAAAGGEGPQEGPHPHPRQPGSGLHRGRGGAGPHARAAGGRGGPGGLRRHHRPGGEHRLREGAAPARRPTSRRSIFDEYDLFGAGGHPAAGGQPLAAARSCQADMVVDHHPLRDESLHVALRGRGRRLRRHLHDAGGVPARRAAGALRGGGHRALLRHQGGHAGPGPRDDARRTSTATCGCSRAWTSSCSAQIEHPELPARYFQLYHTAFERAKVYGDRHHHGPGGGLLPGHGGRGRRAADVPRGHEVVARVRHLPQPALLVPAGEGPADERGPAHPRDLRGLRRLLRRPRQHGGRAAAAVGQARRSARRSSASW